MESRVIYMFQKGRGWQVFEFDCCMRGVNVTLFSSEYSGNSINVVTFGLLINRCMQRVQFIRLAVEIKCVYIKARDKKVLVTPHKSNTHSRRKFQYPEAERSNNETKKKRRTEAK